MKMHLLSGGRLRMRRSVYHPGAAKDETLDLPVSCALLRHGQGNVLFDTGCSPQAATGPAARWGNLARAMTPLFAPADTVVHQLPKAGLGTQDVDLVVCSHLHPDHCGCNEHFPQATVLCHAAEMAAARAEAAENHGYLPQDWDHPQRFQTIEAQYDVFGDGRLVLLPMPGHTPGMLTALVHLDATGQVLLASDAAAVSENLRDLYAPKNSWDPALATAALREIAAIQARGATVIFGHDATQWAGLLTGEAFYQ